MMLHEFQADCEQRLRMQNLPFEPVALRAFCSAMLPAADESGDGPEFWTAEFLQTMKLEGKGSRTSPRPPIRA